MAEEKKHPTVRQALDGEQFDLLVIGGGITGAGIALEAARAGLKTALVEQKDYAWGTSSRSSKMVHGGLRYIAQGDIRLTRESLHERERLIMELPGFVYRQYYLFPHRTGSFPGRFLFGTLLMLYDFLAGISNRKFVDRKGTLARVPGLDPKGLKGSSTYTDSLTDDSRLVMRVLQEAVSRGAAIFNYVKVTGVEKQSGLLNVALENEAGEHFQVQAIAVANATGAFADQLRPGNEKKVRPLRGSHIIFPREKLPIDDVLTIMHHKDKRPIFIYPWAGRTVAGTTDLDHKEDLMKEPTITREELDYLLAEVNKQFPEAKVSEQDIIATFSGVRPVVSSGTGVNPSAERRDHAVWDDDGLVTVTGGKLTTFRVIAHDVIKKAYPYFIRAGLRPKIHHGRMFDHSGESKNASLAGTDPYLKYLAATYGNHFPQLLENGESLEQIQGTPHCLAELANSLQYEQVTHLDDLLLRRTRLGLLLQNGGESLQGELSRLCEKFAGWDSDTFNQEWERYQETWKAHYFLPSN